MCTVVVRWSPGTAVLVLALRDELVGRPFDDPGGWWPDSPAAVGGRDHQSGGTWCASNVAMGTTALVINGTEKLAGDVGAMSRGVLPLLAVEHGDDWPAHIEVAGMASFTIVVCSAMALTVWHFDGVQLDRSSLPPGTHMLTAGPIEEGRTDRHLESFLASSSAAQWRSLVAQSIPGDAADALLVRYPYDGGTFATVFAQVIEAEPGRVALTCSRSPWESSSWSTTAWRLGVGSVAQSEVVAPEDNRTP